MAGILVVDDELAVREVMRVALTRSGFDVWLAADGRQALELYQRHREAIDLVLLDVCMPGLDGPQTFRRLQEIDPDVRACFMSGNAGAYEPEELLQRGAFQVFAKPFRLQEVTGVLARAATESSRSGMRPASYQDTMAWPRATPLDRKVPA